jgi:hypothetical protein
MIIVRLRLALSPPEAASCRWALTASLLLTTDAAA